MIDATPFITTDPVVPPIFAGRGNEIASIYEGLFQENRSIAIFGDDAIGKSSILLTIHKSLEPQKKVFSIDIDSMVLREAIQGDFLSMITRQICLSIWTKMLKKKFSDLAEDTMLNARGEGILITDADEELVKRIYRLVTNTKLEGAAKEKTGYGGKFVLSAESSHEKSTSYGRERLSSMEFLHLVDELNDVVKSLGYDSILIICDEMNHLPMDTNTDILRECLDAFASKRIKFLLTLAKPEFFRKEDFKLLIDAFNAPLEIGHFKDVKSVKELIGNVLSSVGEPKASFSGTSYKTLFELTDGHPWWIQKIAKDAYSEVLTIGRDQVNSRIIEKNSKRYMEEIKLYNEKMAAGQPFRKNMLSAVRK